VNRAFLYLARELAKSYAIIGIALLVLFDLLAFLTESEDIGDARYGVLDALLVVAYRTPALLVDLSPFIALLGTLNALANLSATSELIALRAGGVSTARLGGIAAWVAAGFMALIGATELAARPLHLEASLLRMHQTAPTGNPLRGSGFWTRTGRTIVNVAALNDARRPGGIRMFHFSADGRLEQYQRASSAAIVTAQDWQLEDVWRRSYGADGAPAAAETFTTLQWEPTWDASTRLYDLPVASFSLLELDRRIEAPSEPTGARAAQSEFWRRIMLPLGGIAYALLAAPFALLTHVRGGRATRLALGTGVAFLIYIGEQVVTNASILAALPIAVTNAVPPMLVLIIAVALMRRLD
jgi:lipopolysaccharide export system permease protein